MSANAGSGQPSATIGKPSRRSTVATVRAASGLSAGKDSPPDSPPPSNAGTPPPSASLSGDRPRRRNAGKPWRPFDRVPPEASAVRPLRPCAACQRFRPMSAGKPSGFRSKAASRPPPSNAGSERAAGTPRRRSTVRRLSVYPASRGDRPPVATIGKPSGLSAIPAGKDSATVRPLAASRFR